MRIKLLIEYDGTLYNGWQSQPSGNTIQQKIEYAIKEITGKDANVTGSGRTDAGVHAKGQVAHFDTESTIPPENFCFALNTILPQDIKILSSEREKDDFHARYSAKQKTYEYHMYKSQVERPLKERYALKVNPKIDVEAMKKSVEALVGEHDFKCFLASNSSVQETVRTIYSAQVREEGEDLIFRVTGNGFLYNMVRIIVGTLIDIGEGRKEEEFFEKLLKIGERKLAGKTVSARGLTLISVEY